LDLCDFRNVRDFAHKLLYETVSNPDGLDGEYLHNVKIPRLDSIICNAAFGGWSGMSYPGIFWSLLTKGVVQTATWPEFKLSMPTCILNERPGYNYVRTANLWLASIFQLSSVSVLTKFALL
jgi:3-keto steroid reductase